MKEETKKRILTELKRDARVQRHVDKYPRTVTIHLTEEQYAYLTSQKKSFKKGIGWFLRRLLIIDMYKKGEH